VTELYGQVHTNWKKSICISCSSSYPATHKPFNLTMWLISYTSFNCFSYIYSLTCFGEQSINGAFYYLGSRQHAS